MGQRALSLIKACPVIIGEEKKALFRLLSSLSIAAKEYYFLNEHSTKQDLSAMVEACKSKDAVLLSDCGTPAFCDPGAELVFACRSQNIPVLSVPGPSSLGAFISVCGEKLDHFFFRGFLPAKKEAREYELKTLVKTKIPIVLMDTPYRLHSLLGSLGRHCSKDRLFVLGLQLGDSRAEKIYRGNIRELRAELKAAGISKAAFLVLIMPQSRRAKPLRSAP